MLLDETIVLFKLTPSPGFHSQGKAFLLSTRTTGCFSFSQTLRSASSFFFG
nr:hypothetical protein [uncultured bacterium]